MASNLLCGKKEGPSWHIRVRGRVPERIIAAPGCVDMGAWYGRAVLPGIPIGALQGGGIWTNRAEAHGQLALSPVRLPEQLRSSHLVDLATNFAQYLREPVSASIFC